MEWSRPCCFSHIVVTAPTEQIASIYRIQLQLLKASLPALTTSRLFCIPDPPGCRVGSGGGTTNALYVLEERYGVPVRDCERILIVHSGGDSKRAPLHSLCGKAWMSLDKMVNETIVATPLLLMIKEASDFLCNLPSHTVVVASGDVLLKLMDEEQPLPLASMADDGTYVVAVATSTSVAINHGVLVSHQLLKALTTTSAPPDYQVDNADQYLQKPPLLLIQNENAFYYCSSSGENKSLVDTGLVVFVGSAASALFHLVPSISQSVTPFELYNELLLACYCRGFELNDEKSYFGRISRSSSCKEAAILSQIFSSFHNIALRIIFCPRGHFQHLGTSKELLSFFLTSPAANGESFSVSISSLGTIPFGSLIEYSHLLERLDDKKDAIAKQITVSCLNRSLHEYASKLPVGFLLQQVRLRLSDCDENSQLDPSILLVLHAEDNPKLIYSECGATVFGMTWTTFFQVTSTTVQDIWDESLSATQRTLWNAKLFPVFSLPPPLSNSEGKKSSTVLLRQQDKSLQAVDLQEGLFPFCILSPSSSLADIDAWRISERLSLEDVVLREGDAWAMLCWRELMLATTTSLSAISEDSVDLDVTLPYGLQIIHNSWRKLRPFDDETTISTTALRVLLLGSLRTLLPSNIEVSILEIVDEVLPRGAITPDSSLVNRMETFVDIWHSLSDSWSQWNYIFIAFLRRWLCKEDIVTMTCALVKVFELGWVPLKSFPRLLLWASLFAKDIDAASADSLSSLDSDDSVNTVIDSVMAFEETLRQRSRIVSKAVLKALDGQLSSSSSISLESLLHQTAQKAILLSLRYSLSYILRMSDGLCWRFRGQPGCSSLASAPARIDLAGGWSDTPPICYDIGGAVLNVAINIDGACSLRCLAKCLPISSPLHLSTCRRTRQGSIEMVAEEFYSSHDEFALLRHDQSPCALLKACLVALGIIRPHVSSSSSLSEDLLQIGCSLEIASLSDLPSGSGMGGSSILAATILQAIASALGFPLQKETIVSLTGQVEQLISTGGGWQDQVGGVYGGFKIARSKGSLPLILQVSPFSPSLSTFLRVFNERTFLLYTGHQRLAKNVLINALKNYAMQAPFSGDGGGKQSTVQELIGNAEAGANLLEDGSISDEIRFSRLAGILNRYWELKMVMAPGSCPIYLQPLISAVQELCEGFSLCGAGGGGFAVLMCKSGITKADIEERVLSSGVLNLSTQESNESEEQGASLQTKLYSVHNVQVNHSGLEFSTMTDSDLSFESLLFSSH